MQCFQNLTSIYENVVTEISVQTLELDKFDGPAFVRSSDVFHSDDVGECAGQFVQPVVDLNQCPYIRRTPSYVIRIRLIQMLVNLINHR